MRTAGTSIVCEIAPQTKAISLPGYTELSSLTGPGSHRLKIMHRARTLNMRLYNNTPNVYNAGGSRAEHSRAHVRPTMTSPTASDRPNTCSERSPGRKPCTHIDARRPGTKVCPKQRISLYKRAAATWSMRVAHGMPRRGYGLTDTECVGPAQKQRGRRVVDADEVARRHAM